MGDAGGGGGGDGVAVGGGSLVPVAAGVDADGGVCIWDGFTVGRAGGVAAAEWGLGDGGGDAGDGRGGRVHGVGGVPGGWGGAAVPAGAGTAYVSNRSPLVTLATSPSS